MLFTPFKIKNIELKNRIVRSATGTILASKDGFITDSLIEYYKVLAMGGSGLIITGNTHIHKYGKDFKNLIAINDDRYIEKLSELTNIIHSCSDSKIVIQLNHSGRQASSFFNDGNQAVAPSPVKDTVTKILPRELHNDEIWELIACFAEASKRARTAGFDGIQLHGANGHLINQFLSPHTNKRDDYWGGDEKRRFNFIKEIVLHIKKEVHDDYPLMIKLNGSDYIKGGLTIADSLTIAEGLERIGIDLFEITGGMIESKNIAIKKDILNVRDEAYFREDARLFKQKVKAPIMLVGGIRTKKIAEDILHKNDADLIAMSRPLIKEPDLPNKFNNGKEKADCISCNKCIKLTTVFKNGLKCQNL